MSADTPSSLAHRLWPLLEAELFPRLRAYLASFAVDPNRTPGKREVDAFADLLHGVLEVVEPRTVVAVGRTGEGALKRLGVTWTYVRHPAQGGARKFREGIGRIFG